MAKNKTLLVYYSRSGITEKVAQEMTKTAGCSVDRIAYGKNAKVGFIAAILESFKKKTVAITGDIHNPAKYNHVVFMTPIWADCCATPIRSYLSKFRNNISSYSIVATSASSAIDGVVADFEKTLGKSPRATQLIHSKDIKSGNFKIDKAILGK